MAKRKDIDLEKVRQEAVALSHVITDQAHSLGDKAAFLAHEASDWTAPKVSTAKLWVEPKLQDAAVWAEPRLDAATDAAEEGDDSGHSVIEWLDASRLRAALGPRPSFASPSCARSARRRREGG